jgi:hypothetical protein
MNEEYQPQSNVVDTSMLSDENSQSKKAVTSPYESTLTPYGKVYDPTPEEMEEARELRSLLARLARSHC